MLLQDYANYKKLRWGDTPHAPRPTGCFLAAAMFMGFLISLSSTAIVLKLLQERAEIELPQGRISLGILIFQDVIVVLFIILTPFLAGETGGDSSPSILRLATTGIILIILVLVGGRYVVPTILYQVVRTRNRELFLLTVGASALP